METNIRPYQKEDEATLNSVALLAFMQYQSYYDDWQRIESVVSRMSDLSKTSQIYIAENKNQIVGGIVLAPPEISNSEYFDSPCPLIRLLVVSPGYRGNGIGKMLTNMCIDQAKVSGFKSIGLHTSPIMKIALSMYLKMGFVKIKDKKAIAGVEYSVYQLFL